MSTYARRPRVLVVDDNAAFLDNLQELLGDAGYEVRIADSCRAAREHARPGFDVALVDLRLPDGEGTELTVAPRTTLRLHRVLRPAPDGRPVLPQGATGHVAGAWSTPEGSRARGLFAVLTSG